ncbi:MAG: hypothetical protein HY721_32195 [Planctomycetes bacterium]|nr:hypothetical protein [Planctomycetota bacterium]
MKMPRRRLLRTGAAAAAALLAGGGSRAAQARPGAGGQAAPPAGPRKAYDYRIAFGAWINDMRVDPLPLENWPAPQLDDEAIASAVRAMDVQAEAGFNLLDVWGLFATYGWPPDIASAVDEDRRRRIVRFIEAARRRGLVPALGLGTYSWGYDRIIEADPEVRGKNPDGSPHPHAMCDASPKAFEYVRKIIDFTLGQFDFGAVHLESCDLGCCWCPACAGKDGVVAYNVRINRKTADYIKSRWPRKTVYVITINWAPAGKHFGEAEEDAVVELGKHVDCVFDQGHSGHHIAPARRAAFVRRLGCAYGTSGGVWLYPDTRWDRHSYFLPYPKRAAKALREHHAGGARGCMYYQGPVSNPGQEAMMAFGGRMLSDVDRSPEEALAEVLERLYKPKGEEALRRLARIFAVAEDSYFEQWSAEPFAKVWGIPVPGEFKLDQRLFGTCPGPATYLKEPCLGPEGRKAYRNGLRTILEEIPKLAGLCDDGGRLAAIRRSAIVTLNLLNTISYCLGEPIP